MILSNGSDDLERAHCARDYFFGQALRQCALRAFLVKEDDDYDRIGQ